MGRNCGRIAPSYNAIMIKQLTPLYYRFIAGYIVDTLAFTPGCTTVPYSTIITLILQPIFNQIQHHFGNISQRDS